MRDRLHTVSEATWFLWLTVAWVVFVVGSLALCGPGFIHPESYSFLPHFLSGRPVWQLIFDYQVTDWGQYEARELGFVFDWIDAQFIQWSFLHGFPHFFSVTHYTFLLFAGYVLWWILRAHLGLGRLAAFLMVLLLWTSPSAVLYTAFYRVSKVGVLLLSLLVIWALLAARRAPEGWRRGLSLAIFGALAIAMPMFDKQGLLFLLPLIGFLAWSAFTTRSGWDRRLLGTGVFAFGFAWCYQRWFGAWMTLRIVHYPIERHFVHVSLADLAAHPRQLAFIALGGPIFALDSFRFPLGDLPVGLSLLALFWLGRQFAGMSVAGVPRWRSPLWLFVGFGLFTCALYACMLLVFPLLFSTEHTRFFYGLPILGPWLVIIGVALAQCLRVWSERRRWIEIALAALVLSNVCALQEHRFVLRHGKYRIFCENAARVRAALRPENIASSGVPPEKAAELFKQAPYYPDDVPPSLDKDRIFLLLLDRYFDKNNPRY